MTEKKEPSKFILVIGLQNSGKSTYLLEEYKQECDRIKNDPSGGKLPYFISTEQPIGEWLNRRGFLKFLESKKAEIQSKGIRATNQVKLNYLCEYLSGKWLYIDNIHLATSTIKSSALKLLLTACEGATITTIDESQIRISLRDIILAENPIHIRLKPPKKYLPTFDITPVVFGALVTAAYMTGNYSAAYILAGLATLSFRQTRKAKQS